MKISKLFHWLYALVMLLPIFAVGVTCAYAIFNKNAYQSYYGDTINQSQKHVLGNENTNQNTTYYLVIDNRLPANNTSIYISNLEVVNSGTLGNTDLAQIELHQDTIFRLLFYTYQSTEKRVDIYYEDNNQSTWLLYKTLTSNTFELSFNTITLNNEITAYLEYFTYNKDSYISNVFYYSIEEVQNNSLFNWAYDSFLATPITYITALFGIANDHIAVMLMSYWLAISVIWLVFDLIMYVPLLVHRWLDKGVLE